MYPFYSRERFGPPEPFRYEDPEDQRRLEKHKQRLRAQVITNNRRLVETLGKLGRYTRMKVS